MVRQPVLLVSVLVSHMVASGCHASPIPDWMDVRYPRPWFASQMTPRWIAQRHLKLQRRPSGRRSILKDTKITLSKGGKIATIAGLYS